MCSREVEVCLIDESVAGARREHITGAAGLPHGNQDGTEIVRVHDAVRRRPLAPRKHADQGGTGIPVRFEYPTAKAMGHPFEKGSSVDPGADSPLRNVVMTLITPFFDVLRPPGGRPLHFQPAVNSDTAPA